MAEPLIGKTTLPRLWMYICQLWIIVAVGAIAMVIAVWMMILIQNIDTFQNTMGTYMGNDVLRYPPGDPNNGYVNETNIPKHLGGPVFAAAFDVAMIVFCLIAVAADVFYKFPIAKQILEMMFAVGLWSEAKMTEIEYFFLIANAFLKLFIVAATGAQTYVGIDPNNDDVDTPLFCLYATFILLGSIPLTVIASMFIIQRNKKGEYEDALKAAEAGKK